MQKSVKENSLTYKKQAYRLMLFLFCSFLLSACGPSKPAPVVSVKDTQPQLEKQEEAAPVPMVGSEKDEGKITVALLLPLTGPDRQTGNALLKSATMALFDAYDPRLILLPIDTGGNNLKAQAAAAKAKEAGADIILGPLLGENVKTVGEALKDTPIPIIGFSNDSTVAAPGRYIMGFLPESEIKRVVDYAVEQKHHVFAALVPVSRYGLRVQAAYGDAVTDAGGSLYAIEQYQPNPDAMFDPVKRLAHYEERRKERSDEIKYLRSLRDDMTDELADELQKSEVLDGVPFDAVLVPEGGALLRTLAPLLPFYEVDPNKVQFLGTGLWNDPELVKEPPLRGGLFAAPNPAAPDNFLARYSQIYGEEAPRIATLAYDAMSLVAILAREDPLLDDQGQPLGMFSDPAITSITGFQGVDGLFRFLPGGTIERMLSVIEIDRKGFTVVDEAPEAFPSFGYALTH